MSPVDPISPASPSSNYSSMDISPVEETSQSPVLPQTPSIHPVTRLPRLVTAFSPPYWSNKRRSASHFSLPTPSPLSLSTAVSTPATIVYHPESSERTAVNEDTVKVNFELYESSPLTRKAPLQPQDMWRNEHAATDPFDDTMETDFEPANASCDSPPNEDKHEPFQQDAPSITTARFTQLQSRVADIQQKSSHTIAWRRGHARRNTRPPPNKRANARYFARRSPIHKACPQLVIIKATTLQNRLQPYLDHLCTKLVPLISITNGSAHPSFPTSLLQYHLLTHEQLDLMAVWYHQTLQEFVPIRNPDGSTRTPLGEKYPAPMGSAKVWLYSEGHTVRDIDLAAKRRRFGRFIGLRGCESPIERTMEDVLGASMQESEQQVAERELKERMDREWAEMMKRVAEEEVLSSKTWRGRF